MRTCEFIGVYDRRTKTNPVCGKPAYYEWRVKDTSSWMCKEHGEACAGNYTWELKPIYKAGAAPTTSHL